MAHPSPFDMAPIARRRNAAEPAAPRADKALLVSAPGDAPIIITLPARLAQALERLAAAMPEGLAGGDPRLKAAVCELRAAGVPIGATRAKRDDGGTGWVAVYRLQCEVEAVR